MQIMDDKTIAINRTVNESRHNSWWDGPQRYQYVNRNPIASCQRDTFFSVVEALCGGPDKVGIGLGGNPGLKYVYELNVQGNPAIFADGRWLPFKDNSIDFIISSHVIEHIPNMQKTFIEWVRILKPNAFMAIVLPDKKFFLHDNANPNHKWFDLAPSEVTADELKEILDKLENIDILLFDSNQNNFDINILIRKRG